MTNSKGVVLSYFSNKAVQRNILGNKFCWDIRHGSELCELNDGTTNFNCKLAIDSDVNVL